MDRKKGKSKISTREALMMAATFEGLIMDPVYSAKALAAAEIPIAVPLCTFAQPLVCQSKSIGQEVQKGSTVLPVIYPFYNFDRPHSH